MSTSKRRNGKQAPKKAGNGQAMGKVYLKETKGSRAAASYYKSKPDQIKKLMAGDSTEGKRMDSIYNANDRPAKKKPPIKKKP
jgi:hypothetical protein